MIGFTRCVQLKRIIVHAIPAANIGVMPRDSGWHLPCRDAIFPTKKPHFVQKIAAFFTKLLTFNQLDFFTKSQDGILGGKMASCHQSRYL